MERYELQASTSRGLYTYFTMLMLRSQLNRFFLFLLLLFTCCNNANTINSKARQYNDKANRIIITGNGTKESREKAIAYLDSAIATDKYYTVAYGNKIRVLNSLNRFSEALKAVDQILVLNPNSPNALFNKGLILKRLNNSKANAMFLEALKQYDLNSKEKVTEGDLIGRCLCVYFLEGPDSCIIELKKVLHKYPNSEASKKLLSLVSQHSEEELINNM